MALSAHSCLGLVVGKEEKRPDGLSAPGFWLLGMGQETCLPVGEPLGRGHQGGFFKLRGPSGRKACACDLHGASFVWLCGK